MIKQKSLIIGASIFLAITLVARVAYIKIDDSPDQRESFTNVFHEIKLLKEKNDDLRRDIDTLKANLDSLNSRSLAIQSMEDEITQYKKLDGGYPVFGEGGNIVIDAELNVAWMVDIINELLVSEAQAISINGIRITNYSIGFDSSPNGSLFINGEVLSPPFRVEFIGDYPTIDGILSMQGGFLDRLKLAFPKAEIDIEDKSLVRMSSI